VRSRISWTLLAVLVMATGEAIALAVAQRSHEGTPRVLSPFFTPAPEAARYPGCHSGAFAVTASLAMLPPSVCVRTGATLTVTFDKPPGGRRQARTVDHSTACSRGSDHPRAQFTLAARPPSYRCPRRHNAREYHCLRSFRRGVLRPTDDSMHDSASEHNQRERHGVAVAP